MFVFIENTPNWTYFNLFSIKFWMTVCNLLWPENVNDDHNDKNPLSNIIYIWASTLVFHRSFLFGENESSWFYRPGIKFGTIVIRQAYSNILVQSLNNIWRHNLYISASSPSWINMEVNFSCSNIPLHVLGCLSKSQKRDQSCPWKCKTETSWSDPKSKLAMVTG